MSPRKLSRSIALLFVVVGLFLFRLSTSEPAPRSEREQCRGQVATVEFFATAKQGEWCRLTLADDPRTYLVKDRLERDAALRADLATRLAFGTAVELECMPLSNGGPGGGGGEARSVLRLAADDVLVYDVDARHGAGLGILRFALGAAGLLAMALGASGLWRYRPHR